MRRVVAVVVMAVAMLGLQAASASATTVNVSTTAQLLTAVGQLNNAPDGVSDTINVAPGTYTLTSQLSLTGDALTIEGTGSAANTIIRQTGAARVIDINNGGDDVDLNDLTITGGNVSGVGGGIAGSGGGIRKQGASDLFIERSAVEGNRATPTGAPSGGGGIYNTGGLVSIRHSSVSNNTAAISGSGSGGAGLWSQGAATITDSTFSGNVLTGFATGSGGGGYFTALGGASVSTSTFADNSAAAGAAIFNGSVTAVTLANSIFAGSGTQCAGGGSFTPSGNNIDTGNSCLASIPNTNPKIGPLADNGGGTKTRALAPDSPAIEAGASCTSTEDQRDVSRPVGSECDLGAYEFDGLSVAQVPNCSPTGQIPLGMVAPPGAGVVAFHFRLGGVQTDVPPPGGPGGPTANTVLNIPEGRQTLEYWGEFSNDANGEKGHHIPTVLVDKTDPSVAIQSEQKRTIYVITRKASVDVNATDALSGLVQNPSANGERIGTRSRGKKTFAPPPATDLCGNQQTASFSYQVLGPALGARAVLEKVKGTVRINTPGKGSKARASRFVRLSQPREIPIGSSIDTRKGTLRLTSSKSKKATAIQDGQFSGGVFQVLQSRRKRAKGLTELRLKGGKSFKSCRKAGSGASAALSKAALRRLRASAKGKFRTRGRFSAATVRGTKFTVTDRCDGTLTKVTRGRVAVRDFRRHKTVVVRAGKSYLAKAPG